MSAVFGYRGAPGGPSDPATPGPYCLALCRCGTCPQYADQHRRAIALREAEYAARVRTEHDRAERQAKRQAAERRSTAV